MLESMESKTCNNIKLCYLQYLAEHLNGLN